MIYDDDLRKARRWATLLAAGNGVNAILNLYQHAWLLAAASAIWAMCCLLWKHGIACQQATRDEGRILESGVQHMLEEIERAHGTD